MATLIQIADAFDGADVRKQIVGAVLQGAQVIRNEGGGVPNHARRLKWALKAARSPRQMAERMHGAVLTDATVSSEIPKIMDAAIQAAVDTLVLKFANEGLPELSDYTPPVGVVGDTQ